MKKCIITVIVLALVLSMCSVLMCACGGQKMTVTVLVNLGSDYVSFMYAKETPDNPDYIIPSEDRILLNSVEIEIEYSDDEQINVIRAMEEACHNYELDFETTSNGNGISKIKTYSAFSYDPSSDTYVEGYDEYLTFFWNVTVNGVEAETSASTTYLSNGDTVTITLSAQGAVEA